MLLPGIPVQCTVILYHSRGVDVVFLHGLLGGVFYTWRQQDKDNVHGPGSPQVMMPIGK